MFTGKTTKYHVKFVDKVFIQVTGIGKLVLLFKSSSNCVAIQPLVLVCNRIL